MTISISVNIKNILYVKKIASAVGFEEDNNQLLDSGKYLVNEVEINISYKYPHMNNFVSESMV